MFQISLTRSYNVSNFLEDLKLLYRSCGVQGKGTTFLFSDLDIKEEGFLEYLNNILSSGVISNLFTRDEQQEIVSELTPIMKRENQKKTATAETVMEYFLQRACHNLHVAFCFSPVGETFRHRVQRFPALVSGCTIDWFQPWPKDALVSVARHFLADFQIDCSDEIKRELVDALGTIQDVVSETSVEYFQRQVCFSASFLVNSLTSFFPPYICADSVEPLMSRQSHISILYLAIKVYIR